MASFYDFLQTYPRELRAELAAKATGDQVLAALRKDSLRPEDFMALLSPAAEPYLEEMAQRARELTLRFFGKWVL